MPAKEEFAFTPEQALARLPEVPFEPETADADDPLRRAELLDSILRIAGMDHASESALVRQAVQNALGKLYSAEE